MFGFKKLKNFMVGRAVDMAWAMSKLKVSYSPGTNKVNIEFDLNEEDFELIKQRLSNKLSKELIIKDEPVTKTNPDTGFKIVKKKKSK